MTRYTGTNAWLDVDQHNVAVGTPNSPGAMVLPLSSLAQAQITPAEGGGLLTMMFAAATQPGGLVVPPQRIEVTFPGQAGPEFQALAGWLTQVAGMNQRTDRAAPAPGPTRTTAPVASTGPDPAPHVPQQTAAALIASLQTTAARFIAGDDTALATLDHDLAPATAPLPPGRLPAILWPVMSTAVEAACHDHQVTDDGEQRLNRLISMLGLTWDEARQQIPQAWHDLFLGHTPPASQSQAARPASQSAAAPIVSHPVVDALPVINPDGLPLVLKRGEVVHGVFQAELLKQEVEREFRGGSAGLSFPLGHGVRMRTGAMRGHSVVVGAKSVVADTGPLIVTSGRAVFVGHQHSLEFPYPKLLGLRQYKDGLSLSVSNRQATSVFQLGKHENPAEAVSLISRSAG